MSSRPNLAAILSLAHITFSKLVYRAVPETLREKILSTEGNRYYSGRYHIAGETGILYTSIEPACGDTGVGPSLLAPIYKESWLPARFAKLPESADLTQINIL